MPLIVLDAGVGEIEARWIPSRVEGACDVIPGHLRVQVGEAVVLRILDPGRAADLWMAIRGAVPTEIDLARDEQTEQAAEAAMVGGVVEGKVVARGLLPVSEGVDGPTVLDLVAPAPASESRS